MIRKQMFSFRAALKCHNKVAAGRMMFRPDRDLQIVRTKRHENILKKEAILIYDRKKNSIGQHTKNMCNFYGIFLSYMGDYRQSI